MTRPTRRQGRLICDIEFHLLSQVSWGKGIDSSLYQSVLLRVAWAIIGKISVSRKNSWVTFRSCENSFFRYSTCVIKLTLKFLKILDEEGKFLRTPTSSLSPPLTKTRVMMKTTSRLSLSYSGKYWRVYCLCVVSHHLSRTRTRVCMDLHSEARTIRPWNSYEDRSGRCDTPSIPAGVPETPLLLFSTVKVEVVCHLPRVLVTDGTVGRVEKVLRIHPPTGTVTPV